MQTIVMWSKKPCKFCGVSFMDGQLGRFKAQVLLNLCNFNISFEFSGFSVYRIDEPDSTPFPLETDYFRYHASTARSKERIDSGKVQLGSITLLVVYLSTILPYYILLNN